MTKGAVDSNVLSNKSKRRVKWNIGLFGFLYYPDFPGEKFRPFNFVDPGLVALSSIVSGRMGLFYDWYSSTKA